MENDSFCVGPGSLMGTAGLKWAGREPMDDCSMLWIESWGLTSPPRAALACLLVFLLAALSQYLATADGYQLQQSKIFAKRRLARRLAQARVESSNGSFYDPELSGGCRKKNCLHAQAAEESVVHPELLRAESHGSLTSVKVSNWTHLGDAMMRGVRILLAYLLMLVVMTYDLTLITSIVVGFATSFFMFGKDTAKVPVSADPCCS